MARLAAATSYCILHVYMYVPDCQRPIGAVLQSSTGDEGRTVPENKDELGYTARRKIKREERKGGGSQIRL